MFGYFNAEKRHQTTKRYGVLIDVPTGIIHHHLAANPADTCPLISPNCLRVLIIVSGYERKKVETADVKLYWSDVNALSHIYCRLYTGGCEEETLILSELGYHFILIYYIYTGGCEVVTLILSELGYPFILIYYIYTKKQCFVNEIFNRSGRHLLKLFKAIKQEPPGLQCIRVCKCNTIITLVT